MDCKQLLSYIIFHGPYLMTSLTIYMYSIPVVTGSPSLDGPAPTLVEALMKQVYRDPDVNPRTTAVVIGPS